MDEGNQLLDDAERVSRILEQYKIDEKNMKDLNFANRCYRKCVAGKCPPLHDRHAKTAPTPSIKMRPKTFASKRVQDKVLKQVWKESGRDRRMRILERDLKELDTKIAVASGKTHVTAQENNFKAIVHNIKEIEEINEEIKKEKLQIAHIKSQLERVSQKDDELSRQTESEDQFKSHWRKANRNLEIYEGRVQVARQQECSLTTENHKLRNLIRDMLFDREVFNSYWSKTVKNLKNRRKFLLDMIERSNQAFNRGADQLESLKKLGLRRRIDRGQHITDMVNVSRQIDANKIMSSFLGGKGKKREMAPLEPREIRRREQLKLDYSENINLYKSIIEDIKKVTGVPDINKSMMQFSREENDGFQFYTYFNELNYQIETKTNDYLKLSKDIFSSKDYNNRKLEHFEKRISDLHQQLHDDINLTLTLKDDRVKYETEISKYLDGVMEILNILNCDFSQLQKLLGDHTNVTVTNMHEFLSLLEDRLNEVLAYVYCDQRKDLDILTEDSKLTVKSIKRKQPEKPLKITDIITTQQCAECAEGEDVNRYDENIVHPLDYETLRAIMRMKAEAPEMAFRLHNLSKCNLPRSGIIAGRRYAE